MISVKQAKSILQKNIPKTTKIKHSLLDSLNHVLAKDVVSPINMPPFRQSVMDGFAIHIHNSFVYNLIGEIKAGDAHKIKLKPGEAIKIFTGAAVPDSANAVIQVEKTTVSNDTILLTESIAKDTNIRPIGEQIKTNELALAKGSKFNAATIGFLAGLGITNVWVYRKPAVGIIITGNELIQPGKALEYGKVYDSNSIMLQASLLDDGIKKCPIYKVNDDFINTKNNIEQALSENDIVLVSGGISVGDYDFVKAALEALEVEILFYKVNQKPGKPLLVGKKENKLVFALPGNPAASLTCYYIYVKPTLRNISGEVAANNVIFQKELAHDFTVNNSRSQFLKASFIENNVTILTHQNSSMLNTFAVANSLVYLPEGNYELKKGSKVDNYYI